MKQIIFTSLLLTTFGFLSAQVLSPVDWKFSSKKIADKVYEVRLTATLQNEWHLYSQNQPADAISIPTAIVFNNNPLVMLDGKPIEVGKMEVFKDKKLGISANQYTGKVEFVQKIKLKANAKTNISGTIEYQTCDNKKCLPPKKVNFNVALN